MTTIASIQGDGWVVMGADTQSTLNDYRVLRMGGHKVYDNNGVLIAGCGQGRGLDLLHKGWTAPHPGTAIKNIEALDAWVVKIFIPKVRELFVEGGYDMKEDGDFAKHESAFIFAINGVAYYLDDDYSVDREARGFMAAGSGGDYAMGALAMQTNTMFNSVESATRVMKKVIAVAKDFDAYSGGDTHVYVQRKK